MSTFLSQSFRRVAFLVLIAALIAVRATGQTNVVLTVRGAVEQPLSLTLPELSSMPHVELKAKEKDGHEGLFQGVALSEIIARVKPKLTEKCCGNVVNAVVVIKAADGYRAIFSLPEIDPKFSSRMILLADRRDGQPLNSTQGPLWLIAPDDKVHARWVRQVNVLEIAVVGDAQGSTTNSPPR